MLRSLSILVFVFSLPLRSLAIIETDSIVTSWFPRLAEKMRLKTPELGVGEYEVRIWKKCQLCFGEAHELYLLEKHTNKFTVTKFNIRSNKRGFRSFTQIKPLKPIPDSLWTELIQQDMLTPPDHATIDRQLHPLSPKDSTYTSIEPDGSVSIHAKRQEVSVWISDGESYHVDVFEQGTYKRCEYHNPADYLRVKPKVRELQKFVAILDKLNDLFQPAN
ncbi:hypothetical protein IC229_18955 [Spirosoma sp. BT702]|uniref:Uncharacterized protein n=1 Tax=Spirosoma profusum TaxID=2771354 RepID=A0A927ANW4_9BACT|nr:hypothetical protein [Spirosoma profusum]MBD2702734.1 hypothetical protein [Spirosoma profusum]